MQQGLHWIMVQRRPDPRPFATIGNCVDGEHLIPINQAHHDARVVRVGPFIGTADELTGKTRRHIEPASPAPKSKAWNAYKPEPR